MKLKSDNLTENGEVTADTAEAEIIENAAAVPAKFKDVRTLIKAYTDLEAEFTRRSQRLKELENGNKTALPPDGEGNASSRQDGEEFLKSALANEKVRDAVIGEYLDKLAKAAAVPLLKGGGGTAAPRSAPKSVKEAGALAKQFLNN